MTSPFVEVAFAWISIVLLSMSMMLRPQRTTAPSGFWINGVRPDGAYELRRQPANPDDETPPGVLRGRIYCTGGARAIVVSYRIVGCQR
jgi:hypothetical protein